jgi:hypothetical protein
MDNCRIIEQFNVVKILLEKIQILDQNTIEIILTLYWNYFSKKKTLINWIDIEKLDWDMLSININAINLLKENPDKINWKYLSMNPSAIELLKENQDKIYWYNLSSNPNAIELLKENKDKINYRKLVFNENAIELIKDKIKEEQKLTEEEYNNLDYTNKICFDNLSTNTNAIGLLKEHKDKIHWTLLSRNKNAIDLLIPKRIEEIANNYDMTEYNPKSQLSKHLLSTNKNAINILNQDPDIINWEYISQNTNAIHMIEDRLKYESNIDIDEYINLQDNKICWKQLSNNINAIRLLKTKIKMKERLILKIKITENNTIEEVCKNINYYKQIWKDKEPKVVIDYTNIRLFISINDTLDWSALSVNINAINILKENQDKIDWCSLSLNPSIFTEILMPNIYS